MYKPSVARWYRHPPAGFRFSAADGAAIVFCAILTWSTWSPLGSLAALFPVVLGHFFLFCNIFRIPRKPELVWSSVFLVNVAVWLYLGQFAWLRVLAIQTPVTVLLIAVAVFSKDYHGIGYSLLPWGRRCNSFDGDQDCN